MRLAGLFIIAFALSLPVLRTSEGQEFMRLLGGCCSGETINDGCGGCEGCSMGAPVCGRACNEVAETPCAQYNGQMTNCLGEAVGCVRGSNNLVETTCSPNGTGWQERFNLNDPPCSCGLMWVTSSSEGGCIWDDDMQTCSCKPLDFQTATELTRHYACLNCNQGCGR